MTDPAIAPTGWDLSPVLAPRSIALVGASSRPDSLASQVLANVEAGGFGGRIELISDRHNRIGERDCVASLSALRDPVDLALVLVPSTMVVDVVEDAARSGTRGAIVFSAGFSESGDSGRERQARLSDIASSARMPVVGPNCVGVVTRELNATFGAVEPLAERGVAIVAQSGAVGGILRISAADAGLECAYLINSGNEAVVGLGDYLRSLATDDRVTAICMYAEELRRGRDFCAAALECRDNGKAVIVLPGGRQTSGARAAVSHTGSIAGSDRVRTDLLVQAGVIVADTPEEAAMCARLATDRRAVPSGRRVVVLASSGGTGVLAADQAEKAGLTLPRIEGQDHERIAELIPEFASARNPIDPTPAVLRDPEKLAEVLRRALATSCDVLAVCSALPVKVSERMAAAAAEVLAASDTFSLAAWYCPSDEILSIFRNAGIPAFANVSSAFAALAKVSEAATTTSVEVDPAVGGRSDPAADNERSEQATVVVTEDLIEDSLERAGIPVVAHRVARSASEAAAAAADIGLPVAMKVVSPLVAHRARVGALALDVRTDDAAQTEFDRIVRAANASIGGSDPLPVLVQPMLPRGLELYAGITVDRAFGPIISVAFGGTMVEEQADAVFAMLPLSLDGAQHLVGRLAGAERALGPRGVERIAGLLHQISDWWDSDHGLGQLVEVDLNPIIVTVEGPVIADGLGVAEAPEASLQ